MEIKTRRIDDLLGEFPFVAAYFNDNNLPLEETAHSELTLEEYFARFDEEELEDKAIDIDLHYRQIGEFIKQMNAFLGREEDKVKTVTILPGTD